MIALFVAVALVGPVSAQPQAPIAIVHARAWDGRTDPVDDTTIVISGDRIVSVAVGGAPPAGATIIDAEGGVVTPGFIAPESPIGLVEISLEARARDEAPEGDGADPVRAAFSAADGYNPRSSLIPVATGSRTRSAPPPAASSRARARSSTSTARRRTKRW
jgi:hypothetical protein